ncbi:MAG TPA: hypothetical protein VJT49_03190 [Amycolatopsis sp.]|nr:hypothetical protein [Amycolatopsis sp.]HKS44121.1 hypothetical protein [Amycolatopsis sp.]
MKRALLTAMIGVLLGLWEIPAAASADECPNSGTLTWAQPDHR